jgi:hypothetical protein
VLTKRRTACDRIRAARASPSLLSCPHPPSQSVSLPDKLVENRPRHSIRTLANDKTCGEGGSSSSSPPTAGRRRRWRRQAINDLLYTALRSAFGWDS